MEYQLTTDEYKILIDIIGNTIYASSKPTKKEAKRILYGGLKTIYKMGEEIDLRLIRRKLENAREICFRSNYEEDFQPKEETE